MSSHQPFVSNVSLVQAMTFCDILMGNTIRHYKKYAEAVSALNAGNYELAERKFTAALLWDQNAAAAWSLKGVASYCQGLYEEALQCCDNATRLSPNKPLVWHSKGVALMYQGKFQEAETCFQKAYSLDPTFCFTSSSLGYSYLCQKRCENALKWFEKGLLISGEKEFAAISKALCEYLMANPRPPTCPELREESLQQLTKLNQIETYFCRGRALALFGELEQAKQAFEKCLELSPKYKAASIEIEKLEQLVSVPMEIQESIQLPIISVQPQQAMETSITAPSVSVQSQQENKLENGIEWEEEIAEGSFGTVYKCRINNELVAVKKSSLDPMKIEAAIKEIEVHQKLKDEGGHPNVATMIESRKFSNGQVLLVMKLFDTNLDKHIHKRFQKKKFFQPTTCLSIFCKIVKGLHHLHSHNIAHRDLKPSNILVNKKKNADNKIEINEVALCDFGTSKVLKLDDFTCKTPFVGAIQFIAPEVYKKSTEYNGFKADIWSVGCVLHVILTLQYPYKGMDARTLLRIRKRPDINQFIAAEFQDDVVQVPKDIHEDPIWNSLCNIFIRCTQLDPDSRPSTGDILDMLKKIKKGEEISMPDSKWLVPLLVDEGISKDLACKYQKLFNKQKITRDVVEELTREDFGEMGIPIGDRKRIEKAIKKMKAETD